MGALDPTKAKSKFLNIKNDLLYVKNKYQKSSNGEGCTCIRKVDDRLDFEQMDGSDKKIFLWGRSPATLYSIKIYFELIFRIFWTDNHAITKYKILY